MKKWLTESSHTVYSHPHLSIVEDTIRILPDDVVGERFITIMGKDVALIIPTKTQKNRQLFGLVHQYRYAWRAMSWELPAGLREENEDIIITAQRELEEETGLRCDPEELRLLMSFRSNAISRAIYYVFDITSFEEGEINPENTEDLSFSWKTKKEVLNMLRNGVITHGPSCVGLLWYINCL